MRTEKCISYKYAVFYTSSTSKVIVTLGDEGLLTQFFKLSNTYWILKSLAFSPGCNNNNYSQDVKKPVIFLLITQIDNSRLFKLLEPIL